MPNAEAGNEGAAADLEDDGWASNFNSYKLEIH